MGRNTANACKRAASVEEARCNVHRGREHLDRTSGACCAACYLPPIKRTQVLEHSWTGQDIIVGLLFDLIYTHTHLPDLVIQPVLLDALYEDLVSLPQAVQLVALRDVSHHTHCKAWAWEGVAADEAGGHA
eukprot:1157898-Pelagomonas_calceolata.AAC.19